MTLLKERHKPSSRHVDVSPVLLIKPLKTHFCLVKLHILDFAFFFFLKMAWKEFYIFALTRLMGSMNDRLKPSLCPMLAAKGSHLLLN